MKLYQAFGYCVDFKIRYVMSHSAGHTWHCVSEILDGVLGVWLIRIASYWFLTSLARRRCHFSFFAFFFHFGGRWRWLLISCQCPPILGLNVNSASKPVELNLSFLLNRKIGKKCIWNLIFKLAHCLLLMIYKLNLFDADHSYLTLVPCGRRLPSLGSN